jgi:tRNA G10  N-methylase Trm11
MNDLCPKDRTRFTMHKAENRWRHGERMPNQTERKKKGHRNKAKKTRAMREAVTRRKLRSGERGDEIDPNRRDKRQPGAREFKPDGADKGVGGRAR